VVLLSPAPGDGPVPDYESQKRVFEAVEHLIAAGSVRAAASVGLGGVAEAVFKMGLGNRIGFALEDADLTEEDLFAPRYGSFVLELAEGVIVGRPLGRTTAEYRFAAFGEKLNSAWLQELWERRLEPVFPYRSAGDVVKTVDAALSAPAAAPHIGIAKPRVVIPVFPGTNCEYDTARAFARAGAEPHVLVVNNLTPAAVAESCAALVKAIRESQIVMLPGGFSGGDEPDGSAKFIAAFFRAPAVTEAVRELLQKRDGLMLGICNGFQALIKLGLVPYGDIRPIAAEDPTLTFNTVGRHQSMLVRTRIASNGQPLASPPARQARSTPSPSATARAALWRRAAAGKAGRGGPDRHAVCGPGRQPHDGPALQPQRQRAGRGGHHQPGRPRVRQDGPQRARRRGPLPERPRQPLPADFRLRRGLFPLKGKNRKPPPARPAAASTGKMPRICYTEPVNVRPARPGGNV
jgi:phosphoribosylformylglycinamidine (FGAM) synthase-like amidotransferase family enzyme